LLRVALFATSPRYAAGFSLPSLTQPRLVTFFVIQQEPSWFETFVEEVSSWMTAWG